MGDMGSKSWWSMFFIGMDLDIHMLKIHTDSQTQAQLYMMSRLEKKWIRNLFLEQKT